MLVFFHSCKALSVSSLRSCKLFIVCQATLDTWGDRERAKQATQNLSPGASYHVGPLERIEEAGTALAPGVARGRRLTADVAGARRKCGGLW